VFWGLVTAWRFAACPTRRSPDFANATTDGVVRAPSEFSSTVASPPSITAMQEFVVPRSIPSILAIIYCFYFLLNFLHLGVPVAFLFARVVPTSSTFILTI